MRSLVTSRKELIAEISVDANNKIFTLPTNGGLIPNDRFLYGLNLTFEGRATNAAANNPTGTQVDAPFSLLDFIRVSGTHRVRGQQEVFFDLRGAEVAQLNRLYGGRAIYVTPNTTGAPVFTPTLSVAANGTNDIRFDLLCPFVPLGVPVNAQMGWLLDAPNYDSLKLEVKFSDDKSIFTGQTSASTFSAFGSAAGNAKIIVHGLFAMAGSGAFNGFIPGRLWRYSQEITSGDIVNGANNSRLFNIPRGNLIRAIMLKTGVKSTAATAGNNVYNTLTDDALDNIKVMRGLNRQIRFYRDFFPIKFESEQAYRIYPNTGYGLIDFACRGKLSESLDTRGMIAGPSGDTDLYIQGDVTAAANQGAVAVFEELRGQPVFPAARAAAPNRPVRR